MQTSLTRTTAPRPRPSIQDLGFGRYFSDHMFACDYSAKKGWHSARLIPFGDISMNPGAAVLHYGQAMFEGLKAFYGVDGKIRLFRAEQNARRMQVGAERLCMQAPPEELFLNSIRELVRLDHDWIPTAPETALYIRPTLIGTEAFLGVRPAEEEMFYVITSPVGSYYGSGFSPVKIWVETEHTRAAQGGLGASKTGANYAASLQAAVKAKARGYSQVLWLDASTKSSIEEVGTMNVFFRIKDKVVTPPLGGTILPGVMRDSVISILKQWSVGVEERPVTLGEVKAANQSGELREVFGSGTAASISPVGLLASAQEQIEINGSRVGELSQKLYSFFQDLQYGRINDANGWTETI